MTEKEKQLINKIKAMIKGGTPGERASAENQLKKMMKKFGITEDDLNQEETYKIFSFKFNKDYRRISKRLFLQILSHIRSDFDSLRGDITDNECSIVLKPEEAIEIQTVYDYYFDKLMGDYKLFYEAFILKNDLYPKKEQIVSSVKLNEDDLKVLEISKVLDRHEFLKQLSNK